VRAIALLIGLAGLLAAPPAGAQDPDCVVLLHGLGGRTGQMEPLARALRAEGFAVVNQGYPSRSAEIDSLARFALPIALNTCPAQSPAVHFVTHSMGGILTRHFLSTHDLRPRTLGRVVLLGPPNGGSELVDRLRGVPGFDIGGSARRQLGTDPESVPARLPPVGYEVGVIAGSRTLTPLSSALLLPGLDDGLVTVAATCLAGMTDHIVLPLTHPFMMRSPTAIRQTIRFLKAGAFDADVGRRGACR
jgi:pimeloyl-ACP methyl ester carboxylesterase